MLKDILLQSDRMSYVQHDTVTCVKDSLIPLPADSGLIKALLECQDGKVVVKEILEVKPGKRVVPFLTFRIIF